jgi:hypothetical protein
MLDQGFPIGRRIERPGHFAQPVVLESVRKLGDGFECRDRLADGTPDEAILSRDEAGAGFGGQAELPNSVRPVDAEGLRLIVESSRIRLAYSHNRHFAVSREALPVSGTHQGCDRFVPGRPQSQEEEHSETAGDHRRPAGGGLGVSSAELPILKSRELIRALERMGFRLVCKSRESHWQFEHPDGRATDHCSRPQGP